MQFTRAFVGLAVLAALPLCSAQSPVTAVVKLLTELEARIQGDGKVEQQSYDKTACWCEETLARKAKDIEDAKAKIIELQTLIEKLEGEVATHGAEIAQLKKDIAANLAAQKEATEMREKQSAEYSATKTEAEQCLGALEAAITVLTPAGTGAGFLSMSNLQEAKVITVGAGLRNVLAHLPLSAMSISEADLQAVQMFVEHPKNFIALQKTSALQVSNNPAGDYAPQSTQIQGVLKGLYDSFAASLEKANGEESDQQKAFEELMATKQSELETLQATLKKHESDHAAKSKTMAESKQIRDDTMAQLKADEVFFQDTKDSCKALAVDWATRSRLRTEELQGIAKALEILNSPEAQAIFAKSASTLLQVTSSNLVAVNSHSKSAAARAALGRTGVARLRTLAAQSKSPLVAAALSALALEAETGGNKAFDKVLVQIDAMIVDLRKEEQDDIAHRDRCEKQQGKNANDMEDLDHSIQKTKDEISRMETKESELKASIETLTAGIKETESEMATLLKLRNKAVEEFREAVDQDTQAVELLTKALTALTAYYKKNTFLVQRKQEPEVEYTVDKDKMPDAGFSGAAERKGDSAPIIGMIEAIKVDIENEIKTTKADDATAQKDYEKQRGAMRNSVKADTETKVATETELAELQASMEDKASFQSRREADLSAQKDMKATLGDDCSWVQTHFDSRRDARKTEIQGLEEAKSYLAGSEDPL
jgi:predicted  nucleic acid-binding Zn-ribbon protein